VKGPQPGFFTPVGRFDRLSCREASVERLLVAGVDSVVGSNLAVQLADRYRVSGTSDATKVCVDGCETLVVPSDPRTIHHVAASNRPNRIVICGVAGDSPWHQPHARIPQSSAVATARSWIQAARNLDVPLTLVSSDSIFCGPWMFHTETSSSYCKSPEANALRALEADMLAACPGGLVVRTHAYGWSALPDGLGWIEGIVSSLDSEQPGFFDCGPYATPILASDLADVLYRAWQAGLSGVYHIAGAERTNPYRFVKALAGVFDLAAPGAFVANPADAARSRIAQGETSLHTRKIRRSLGLSMPLVIEGLQRLRDQRTTGFDRRLQGGPTLTAPKVA
jgi:dTDP-4-dehydrorhamnose reductase